MRSQIAFVACLLGLAACGGGGGGSSAPPPTPAAPSPPPAVPSPPPPAPTPPPVIGTGGGTVTETTGAKVTFPAGAVTEDTTFRIAADSTGAPPVPASLKATGSVYAITPHGGHFTKPVEVSISVPTGNLLNTQEYKLAKAEPNGTWEVLGDSEIVDGKLKANVQSFSYFTIVIVTYPLPILQLERMRWSLTYDCGGQDCSALVGPVTLHYTVNGNGGQLPQPCTDGRIVGTERDGFAQEVAARHEYPLTGGGPVTVTVAPPNAGYYTLFATLECWETGGSYSFSGYIRYDVMWKGAGDEYPNLSIARVPQQLDVVEGLPASVEALLFGGARKQGRTSPPPTATDHAVIEWMRSDNEGQSWKQVGTSFQQDGNPQPFGTGLMWAPWSVKHVFTATAADQGALIRINACYTPPAPTAAPPCVTSTPTRINVLQHSVLPVIVDPPRSVLIRTAETANFSVNVSGAPAPTLQWQTRPANSTGEWTNVSLGSGATSANYTTAPRTPVENGEQYRVVATNALGSAVSTAVTLSVSDLDIAPSITTQPASLNVTSGNDAVFAVVAVGTEALGYQWRFNGTNITGANNPVLRLSGVTGANAGSYSVAITNNAGSAASNAAVLTVTSGIPVAVAPSIVTQPAAVSVNTGNTATFAVGVDGTGPFTFQWYRDGAKIAGANSASLTFNSVALPNAGSYSVVVSNSAGTVTSASVILDVLSVAPGSPPSITSQPSTVIVPSGGSAILAVAATGAGPLSYQWNFNGSALPGATLPVLTLSNVDNANVGNYTVSVTNSLSSVTSQAAQLILLGAPVIKQDPAALTAAEGNTATFSVAADGSNLHYQWLRNGTQIPGANDASYTTPLLVAANTGAVYSVMIYNGAGLVTSQGAVLTVQVDFAPTVTQQPANITVQLGDTAQFCAAFAGTEPLTLHLQRWNGTEWKPFADMRGFTGQLICYPYMEFDLGYNGAQFRFVAENAAGQVATNTITLTVTSPGITKTTLVSAELDGRAPEYSSGTPSISADGRFVAFTSAGINLVAGTTAARRHAYLRDLSTRTTILINQPMSGSESEYGVQNLKLSADGRYALFTSFANDLVPDDTNDYLDVFRRDLQTGTTERVTVLPNGQQIEGMGNGNFDARLAISGDGRFVTFMAPIDLDVGGTGQETDSYYLYVRDMQTGTTRYIDGNAANAPPGYVAISEDGRYVAYVLNVVAPNSQTIWYYDTETHTKRAAYTYQQPAYPDGQRPGLSISATGRYIAFAVNALNFTESTFDQVMVVDLNDTSSPILASTSSLGFTGDGHSDYPQISGDGRYVLFETYAPNLTGGLATPSRRYSVVRDLVAGTTKIASIGMNGDPVSLATNNYGSHVISSDGKTISFENGQVYATPRP